MTIQPDTEQYEQEPPKSKRMGRPKGPGFVSELPPPARAQMWKPDEFFEYVRSIPKEKLTRIVFAVYRYMPVVDATENGTKPKSIDIIAGEDDPFADENWEKVMLHRYGSGNYGIYLNENNKTIVQCRKIDTTWDPENYPPNINPKWLLDHPMNGAYVSYLRGRGQLPEQNDRQKEIDDMQTGEAMKTAMDTIQQLSMRAATPVPPAGPSMTEKLTFETAKAAIDMVSEQAKVTGQARTNENNPLELVNALVNVAEKMGGSRNGESQLIQTIMQESMKRAADAEERSQRMFETLLKIQTAPPPPAKTLIDQMREMSEIRSLMKEVTGDDDDGESKSKGSGSILTEVVRHAPDILKMGTTMWSQFNQSLGLMAQMKAYELAAQNGQLQSAPTMPRPAQTGPVAQSPGVPTPMDPTNASAPPQAPGSVDPATGAPYSSDELEARAANAAKYRQYHGFIGSIAQPLVTHLNDENKDGYDFAEWFIAGSGRLMYNQVKSVSLDDLMGAIQSFDPLWATIGGDAVQVREFVNEFLTYDDAKANGLLDATDEDDTVQ